MRPVEKGVYLGKFAEHGDAKPELINRLGKHCCYCEAFGEATALDVEHIYPQKAHPKRAKEWDNFLLSCKSCNSKKNSHLGSGKQRALMKRYLWSHTDNTARAFQYHGDGRVEPAPTASAPVRKLAEATIKMIGSLSSPAAAGPFEDLSIAYTGVSIRSEVWAEIAEIKKCYVANPSPGLARALANLAVARGYFSIWMEVFKDRPEYRRELIVAFKADPKCFDAASNTVPKGRT